MHYKALNHRHNGSPYKAGFSLLELMVTVAIIAIIATTAVPSYISYIARGNRASCIADINNIAQALERYYTFNRAYSNDFLDLNMSATTANTISGADGNCNYTILNVAAATDNQVYTIESIPTPSAFADDTRLRLDQLGRKTHNTDSGSNFILGWP